MSLAFPRCFWTLLRQISFQQKREFGNTTERAYLYREKESFIGSGLFIEIWLVNEQNEEAHVRKQLNPYLWPYVKIRRLLLFYCVIMTKPIMVHVDLKDRKGFSFSSHNIERRSLIQLTFPTKHWTRAYCPNEKHWAELFPKDSLKWGKIPQFFQPSRWVDLKALHDTWRYLKEILIPIYKLGYLKSSSLFLSSEVRGKQVEKTIIATGCILLV